MEVPNQARHRLRLANFTGPLLLLFIVALGVYLLRSPGSIDSGDLYSFLFASLGILSLALGIERASLFHGWLKQLDAIDADLDEVSVTLLEESPWAWFIKGSDQVYQSASELVEQAEIRIRAFSMERSARTSSVLEHAIIRHLRERRDDNLLFQTIYPSELSTPEERLRIWREAASRLALHDCFDVASHVSFSFLDEKCPIGFSMLLIDKKHALVAIPSRRSEPVKKTIWKKLFQRRGAIYKGVVLLRNQPQAVGRLVDWFQEVMSQEAWTLEKLESRVVEDAQEDLGADAKKQGKPVNRRRRITGVLALLEAFAMSVKDFPSRIRGRFGLQGLIVVLFFVQALFGILFSFDAFVPKILGFLPEGWALGGDVERVKSATLVLLLSLMALAIGLERGISFPSWSRKIFRLQAKIRRYRENIVSQLSEFKFLEGEAAVIHHGMGMVKSAEVSIRALSFGGAEPPQGFQEAVQERLRSVTDLDLSFTSVVAASKKNIEQVRSELQRRLTQLDDARVSFCTVEQESFFCLDLLIVDSKELMLGIRSTRTGKYSGALCFRGQEALSEYFEDWLESFVLDASKPVEPGASPVTSFPHPLRRGTDRQEAS